MSYCLEITRNNEPLMRKHRRSVLAIGIHVLSLCDSQPELQFLMEMLYLGTEVKRHHARLANKKKKKKWKERADVRALTYGLTLATNGTINRACQRVRKSTAMYIF